jgi:hypothetical protein
MAHYALLDDNNIVTQVIVGRDENDLPEGITDWEDYYGAFHGQTCRRTSYNTVGGQHLTGGTPYRLNYAAIGDRYDPDLDGFIPPQPFPNWILDETAGLWIPPIPYPDDGPNYLWDQDASEWIPEP